MEHKLTAKTQHSKRCNDGRRRNFLLFFIDGTLVLQQKVPYDETMEWGYDGALHLEDVYYQDGRIYQTRIGKAIWSSPEKRWIPGEKRNVHFPVSRKILKQLDLPEGSRLQLTSRC